MADNQTPDASTEETVTPTTTDAQTSDAATGDGAPAEKEGLLDKVTHAVAEAAETVVEKAQELAHDAVETVQELAHDAAEKVQELTEDAGEAVKGAATAAVGAAADAVDPDDDATPSDEAPAAEADTSDATLAETVTETVESAVDTVTEAVSETVETATAAAASAVDAVADAVRPAAKPRKTQESVVGYTGKDLGRTVTLEELEGLGDGGGPSGEMDLTDAYSNSMSAVEADQVVDGIVVGMTDKELVVDIGFKSDGVVAKNEFATVPKIGDTIQVYVDRLEDRRGQLMLSREKAIHKIRWNVIDEAMETGAVIEGEIVKRIKGGMIVNLLGSEAFLPGSQVDVRPVRDFDVYLGKTMEFKVVKTNPQNGNVVISHKALIEKDLQEQRKSILDSLEVGQVLEGQVKNIVNFGVFVDLGGVDGLLHITDLSWGRVGHPSEVIELDQKLNVVVLDYDKERQRISLGYKQLQRHPWDDLAERIAEGMEIEGKVVSITDYGAFVEIERGIEGLVHISEMSWTEHVKHPTQRVQLGQTVQVKVLKIDPDDKKISLGMKQLEPDPWDGLMQRFPVGTVTRGKVRNITTFGAFVEIEPGIDGLVHVSDLSWTKRVKHPSEVVKKGQELDVVVLDIDAAQRRISLGHKQVMTDPWNQYLDAYPEGTDTPGTVTDLNDGGLVVDLPLGAEAFVPASHLARGGRPTDVYQIGDTLDLRVIRTDREDREIVLSETAAGREAERSERDQERAEKNRERQEERRAVETYGRQATGPATLGELSGLAALRNQLADAEATADAPAEPAAEAPTEAEASEVEGEALVPAPTHDVESVEDVNIAESLEGPAKVSKKLADAEEAAEADSDDETASDEEE